MLISLRLGASLESTEKEITIGSSQIRLIYSMILVNITRNCFKYGHKACKTEGFVALETSRERRVDRHLF